MRETIRLGVRLMAFALVAGLLLAVVNAVTAEPIARNREEKVTAARVAVIGEYTFEPVETDLSAYDCILGVYAAKDAHGATVGYVYELSNRGYAGEITLSVGLLDGQVNAVSVSGHSETKGLGSADEAPFLAAFDGLSQPEEALSVDAMSGATVSSTAVREAVSQALAHARDELGAGEVQ